VGALLHLGQFASALLGHPLLPMLLLPVIAVLFDAGRGIGLPLLFWHEDRGPRFLAGLASTLLAAHLFFISYLLAGDRHFRHFPGLGGLTWFLIIGGTGWLILVLAAALVRTRGYRRANNAAVTPTTGTDTPAASQARMAPGEGVAPAIQRRTAEGTRLQSVQVPVAALLLGVAVAGAVVAALLAAGHKWGQHLPAFPRPWTSRCSNLDDNRLHWIALAAFVAFAVLFFLLRRRATPALGLCMLLGLVAAVHGAGSFWLCSPGLGLLLLLALLLWAGRREYKIRLPVFGPIYDHPVAYPPKDATRKAPRPEAQLLPADLLPAGTASFPRRLIVICTSGGGIRAAAWTAAVLGRLEQIGARDAIHLITGASGGMMGAACWVADLHGRDGKPDRSTRDWTKLVTTVAMNSLTPLARRLVFRDLPLSFVPVDNHHDRGRALEDAWVANLQQDGINLTLPLGTLRAAERDGRLPSLVFSPMLVEDGRRLIISNRDVRAVTDNEVRWLSSERHPRPQTADSSRGAYHLSDLLPGHWDNISLATAARLSASFPYISPAAVLPTRPRRRAVDAGYYDAYGLDLLCNLLREALLHPGPLLARVSGILLVQIRDNVSQLSINPDRETVPMDTVGSQPGALARGLEGVTTPVSGALAGREAVSLFRSDAQLETLCRLYAQASGNPDFLTTTIFDFRGEASLSWYLTGAETQGLREQAESPGINGKLQAISAWLQGP
jgi:hypothetical protein